MGKKSFDIIAALRAEAEQKARGHEISHDIADQMIGALRLELEAIRHGLHSSDCALHNAPALPVGPCDCWMKEREALRLELDQWKESARAESLAGDEARADRAQMSKELEASKKRAERLEGALREYGKHDSDCILSRWSQGRPTADGGYECMYGGKWYQARPEDKTPKCECGFDEALSLEAGEKL